jgi:integrase
MGMYKGISKKIMKDRSTHIMVRFKHNGITYPVKNFTKLFGCKTEKEASEKLGDVKAQLSKNQDPFVRTPNNLNELYEEMSAKLTKNLTWSESSNKTNTSFYNKYIRKTIGLKRLEKITYEDLTKILDGFTVNQISMKKRFNSILRPIFKEQKKMGNLFKNVMEEIETVSGESIKVNLDQRINTDYQEVLRRFYFSVQHFETVKSKNKERFQMYLYMLVLTAHRVGELSKLRKEHCDLQNRKIIAPASITKTRRDYHYPIPDEVYDFIQNHPGGLLFGLSENSRSSATRLFKLFSEFIGVEVLEGHNFTSHDMRKLLMTVMVSKCGIDSALADYTLEHKQQGMKKHYINFTYQDKVNAYKKYWTYLRNLSKDLVFEPKSDQENLIDTFNRTKIADEDNEFDFTSAASTLPPESTLDKLERLGKLFQDKLITEEEFQKLKSELIN